MLKINFGSGPGKLPGWLNVDVAPEYLPDLVADLRKPLPFDDQSIDFIHSEDFLVQLNIEESLIFLRECRRILKPRGVMRLLTPDLEKFAKMYLEQPAWLVETWEKFVGVPLKTRTACEVFNVGIRMAGQFHYDRSTFRQIASSCGFRAYEVSVGTSAHPELRGIDLRRPDESISMYFECVPVD